MIDKWNCPTHGLTNKPRKSADCKKCYKSNYDRLKRLDNAIYKAAYRQGYRAIGNPDKIKRYKYCPECLNILLLNASNRCHECGHKIK